MTRVANRSRMGARRASRATKAGATEEKDQIECPVCGRNFTPVRSTARFCSNKCRQQAHRDRQKGDD